MMETARLALLVGAAGSVGLMLVAGQRTPRVLLLLFAIWVLSPFVGLAVAGVASKRWPARARATVHTVMLAVALVSLALYAYAAIGPLRERPAPVFVMVPPATWVLGAVTVAVAIGARVPGRRV